MHGDGHDNACDLLTQCCGEATRMMSLALISLSQVSRKPVSSLSGTHLWSSLFNPLVIQFPSPLLIVHALRAPVLSYFSPQSLTWP